MMKKSTLRVAATAMAIACAAAVDAQQTDAPAFAKLAAAKMVFEASQATVEQPVAPVRLAEAKPAAASAQPDFLSSTAAWTPLLVLFGLLALVGAVLLMTKRQVKPSRWESDEMEAARGRQRRLAEELQAIWAKTTTTETLLPRSLDEPKPALAVPK